MLLCVYSIYIIVTYFGWYKNLLVINHFENLNFKNYILIMVIVNFIKKLKNLLFLLLKILNIILELKKLWKQFKIILMLIILFLIINLFTINKGTLKKKKWVIQFINNDKLNYVLMILYMCHNYFHIIWLKFIL